jgi:cytochrome b subunit of formate dehydrogenase
MTPGTLRRSLHHVHVVATLLLLATGWMIEYPELRATLLARRDRWLDELHLWVGFGFLAAPLFALALGARPLLRDLRRRLGPPDALSWRNAHIALTLGVGAALALSGVVLWRGHDVPRGVEDAAFAVHSWSTWVFAASLPVHLFASRRKIAQRAREIVLRERPPLFEYADETLDEE